MYIGKSLNSVTSKILYVFLRDSNGKYVETKRFRNVDIEIIRLMLGYYDNMTNSEIVRVVRKSIVDINKFTNLLVDFTTQYEICLKSRKKSVKKLKFTIKLNSKVDVKKTNPLTHMEKSTEISDGWLTVNQQKNILTFDEFVEKMTNDIIKSRNNIKNINLFKNGVIKKLKENEETEFKYCFYKMMEEEKNKLRGSLDNSYQYILVLYDDDNDKTFYLNSDYLFVDQFTNKIMVEDIYQSWDFLEDNLFDCCRFIPQKCSYLKSEYNLITF